MFYLVSQMLNVVQFKHKLHILLNNPLLLPEFQQYDVSQCFKFSNKSNRTSRSIKQMMKPSTIANFVLFFFEWYQYYKLKGNDRNLIFLKVSNKSNTYLTFDLRYFWRQFRIFLIVINNSSLQICSSAMILPTCTENNCVA